MKGSRAKRGLFRGRYVGATAQSLTSRSMIEIAVPIPRRHVGIVRTVEQDQYASGFCVIKQTYPRLD